MEVYDCWRGSRLTLSTPEQASAKPAGLCFHGLASVLLLLWGGVMVRCLAWAGCLVGRSVCFVLFVFCLGCGLRSGFCMVCHTGLALNSVCRLVLTYAAIRTRSQCFFVSFLQSPTLLMLRLWMCLLALPWTCACSGCGLGFGLLLWLWVPGAGVRQGHGPAMQAPTCQANNVCLP